MSNSIASVLTDLAFFADLGTAPPTCKTHAAKASVELIRNGRLIELVFHDSELIEERVDGQSQTHLSFRALLASPNFSDLGRWATAQSAFLNDRVSNDSIPIEGIMSTSSKIRNVSELSNIFIPSQGNCTEQIQILLVDGPAGVGKTSLIRKLAFDRARQYRQQQRPLVLHVESRGRVLQNITDLMAFSLQTLRVNVTYDQVPVLVRLGLVTLAIDGFDELADPNGYTLAWAQVNELINKTRGAGSLLLAGRETFIGYDRLVEGLAALKNSDNIQTLTVQSTSPGVAKRWLLNNGWDEDVFEHDNVEPLFEVGSYALRPFFLVELAREDLRGLIESETADDLNSILIDAMIDREATKFGQSVDAVTTIDQRKNFIREFLCEISRELADNQTEAIADESLAWIAEFVGERFVPLDIVQTLKVRAGVIAFLTNDDRRSFKRFSHSQIQNYFLALVTLDALSTDEIPKFVRRNILGADFLSVLADVIGNCSQARIRTLTRRAIGLINDLGDTDRARRNLASIVLLAMGFIQNDEEGFALNRVFVDESLVVETVGALNLVAVTINQLDARSADLNALVFDEDCHIASLLADDGTRFSPTFPLPRRIQLQDKVLNSPDEIEQWMNRNQPNNDKDLFTTRLTKVSDHGLLDLVGRACRYRPFWMRPGEDRGSRRLLISPYWEDLQQVLIKNDLLLTKGITAAGQKSEFFHIRRKEDILARHDDTQISQFYSDLLAIAESGT